MPATPSKSSVPFVRSGSEGPPEPVQRYLAAVSLHNRAPVRRARLTQSGVFRIREEPPRWEPFTAEQAVTTEPKGFVWKAKVRMGRLLSVRVVDAYQNGAGFLRARLLGIVPLAKAEGPEADDGELMRYLSEAVWYPSALMPDTRLRWQPVDDRAAVAVLRDCDHEVALKFSFDGDGLVFRVDGDRFRTEKGGYRKRPWTAYCSNYAERYGFLIPLEARVAWHLPGGEMEYFRGSIQSIEYDP